MGRTLYDTPSAICLTADVGVELRQRFELPAAKLICPYSIRREKDPDSQELGQQDSAPV